MYTLQDILSIEKKILEDKPHIHIIKGVEEQLNDLWRDYDGEIPPDMVIKLYFNDPISGNRIAQNFIGYPDLYPLDDHSMKNDIKRKIYDTMLTTIGQNKEVFIGVTLESFLDDFKEFSLITSCVNSDFQFLQKKKTKEVYPDMKESLPIYYTMYGVNEMSPSWKRFMAVKSFLKWVQYPKNNAIVSFVDIEDATEVYNKLSDFENIYDMYNSIKSLVEVFNKELLYIQKKMDIFDNHTISLED